MHICDGMQCVGYVLYRPSSGVNSCNSCRIIAGEFDTYNAGCYHSIVMSNFLVKVILQLL